MRGRILFFCVATAVLQAHVTAAQVLTGALIGTVKDAQGGALQGAVIRVSAPVLIGGPQTLISNEKGQLRFPALTPGIYMLDVEAEGFSVYEAEWWHFDYRDWRDYPILNRTFDELR